MEKYTKIYEEKSYLRCSSNPNLEKKRKYSQRLAFLES
jgi:hypothetical protein